MECQFRLMRRLGILGVVALLSMGMAGCGSSGAAKTHKVTGKVTTADGSPVSGAAVSFQGSGSKAFAANGTTGTDGSYSLSTFDTDDGAPDGEYNVAISDAQGTPMKIVDGKSTATVAPGTNTIDFKVQPGPAPAAAPAETPEEPETP
jgi:hypothetical protein